GGGGRIAGVVDAGGRQQEARARERADADVLGLEARHVAEGERYVVADGLRGGDAREQRVADLQRAGEVFEAQRGDRVLCEFGERHRGLRQLRVERGRRRQVDGADFEGVAERLGDRGQGFCA